MYKPNTTNQRARKTTEVVVITIYRFCFGHNILEPVSQEESAKCTECRAVDSSAAVHIMEENLTAIEKNVPLITSFQTARTEVIMGQSQGRSIVRLLGGIGTVKLKWALHG